MLNLKNKPYMKILCENENEFQDFKKLAEERWGFPHLLSGYGDPTGAVPLHPVLY